MCMFCMSKNHEFGSIAEDRYTDLVNKSYEFSKKETYDLNNAELELTKKNLIYMRLLEDDLL